MNTKLKKILMALGIAGGLLLMASGAGLLPGRWSAVARLLGTVAVDAPRVFAPADAGDR